MPVISSTAQTLQTTRLSWSQWEMNDPLTGLPAVLETTRSLKVTQIGPRVTTVINVSMSEKYDDHNRIVSERIPSNEESHLEDIIRITLYLLSNHRVLGRDEDEFPTEDKDKLSINFLGVSGVLNASEMRSLMSLKGATAHAIAEKLFASQISKIIGFEKQSLAIL